MKRQIKRVVQTALRSLGYQVCRIDPKPEFIHREADVPYEERDEYGASNLQTKLDNVKAGQPFECPDIVNLNHAVVLLIEDEKRIVELGSGTGKFAREAARDQSRLVVASEFDHLTHHWCLENIPPSDNLKFLNSPIPDNMRPFDLAVSIEVVEHIKNYTSFLEEMSSLAPRSLLTTPNRKRSSGDFHAGPPNYYKHVREWTAGEFYWVLRCFWHDVRLYALTSQSKPSFIKVNVDTELSPLLADCRHPIANS